jgi:hypothetical protein
MIWKRKNRIISSETWGIGSGAHELENDLGLGFKGGQNVGAHEAGAEDDAPHSCIEPTW